MNPCGQQQRRPWLPLISATLLLGLAACGKAPLPPEPPRPVLTRLVGLAAPLGGNDYAGEIRSRIETTLAFRLPGKISERLVDNGAVVAAGQVLARLDPADARLALVQAEAQLSLAQADVARYRQLRQQQFISPAALDARETTLKAAQAQADLARNQTRYTELRADQAGVVSLLAAEVGQVVAAGQPVLRIARHAAPEVAIALPEQRIGSVRRGDAALITLWTHDAAGAPLRYPGRVRELAAVADPATRTFAARISFDAADAQVQLGMSARVHLAAQGRPAGAAIAENPTEVGVPLTAIFQKDGKPALWLVDAEQRVTLREVVVTHYGPHEARLASGVAPGERIVVAGVHKLAPGQEIRATEAAGQSQP